LREGIVSYFTSHKAIDLKMYMEDLLLKKSEAEPISFKATTDLDADKFKEAMKKEVSEHTQKGHWRIIRKSNVPDHSKILPAVWSMKHKRRIETRKVYKHEARLNLGSRKQEYGVHYRETYLPVVRWTSIQMMLILSILRGWSTQQLDFVMAYPQANISSDHVYIEIPKGFEFEEAEAHTAYKC
jgi:Reverse transcriptase (RNA-dependent DNA polymerase)